MSLLGDFVEDPQRRIKAEERRRCEVSSGQSKCLTALAVAQLPAQEEGMTAEGHASSKE